MFEDLLGLTYIIIPAITNSTFFIIDEESVLFRSDLEDTQLTFTCSKSPIETIEKEVKYVQS